MTLFTIKTEKKIFTTKNSLLNLEDSTKEEEENSNKISNKGNLYITEKKYKKISDKLKITSRTYFKHRNLIKKVKTNCINIFEKLISNCLSIEQSIFSFAKNKKKRDVLRYFKSDISKLRNYFLLKIKMKDLISLFCDFDFNLYKKYIISDKEYKLNFLLNLTWKEFLLYLKNNNQIITNEIENLIKINNKDFDIFFNYILEINYTYDLRPSVDSLYANNLEKIINKSVQLNNEIQRQNDFFNFILNYE
jgi:hypothetical protein